MYLNVLLVEIQSPHWSATIYAAAEVIEAQLLHSIANHLCGGLVLPCLNNVPTWLNSECVSPYRAVWTQKCDRVILNLICAAVRHDWEPSVQNSRADDKRAQMLTSGSLRLVLSYIGCFFVVGGVVDVVPKTPLCVPAPFPGTDAVILEADIRSLPKS